MVPKGYILSVICVWLLRWAKEQLHLRDVQGRQDRVLSLVECGVLFVFNQIEKASSASACGAIQLAKKGLIFCQVIAHHSINLSQTMTLGILLVVLFFSLYESLWIITMFDLKCNIIIDWFIKNGVLIKITV